VCQLTEPGQDGRGLWFTGRAAQQSGIAGLAGDGIHSHRLGREGIATLDRDLGSLSPIVKSHAGVARARPGESLAGAWATFPLASGTGARQCTDGERLVEQYHRWAECLPLPAAGFVGGDGLWRRLLDANLCAKPDYDGQNDPLFRILLAEIIAEAVCSKSLELETKERTWEFRWADLKEDHLIADSVRASLQQRLRDFVAGAHAVMLSNAEVARVANA
jgi:hypothetical protein